MEADLAQLGSAFNQNSQIFSHGLALAEVHLRVHERVLTDVFNGTARTIDVDGKKVLDFKHYFTEFVQELKAQELAAAAKREEKTTGVILPPSADDTLVFGGGP